MPTSRSIGIACNAAGPGGGTDNGADICAEADTTAAASITPSIPVRTTA
jgi:hypothetical protein